MIPNCTNGSKKTKGTDISYHRLPSDRQLRKTWLKRVRRENIPKENSCYVCSVHFTPDCFEFSLKLPCGQKTKKILKSGSVPSIFPFSSRKPGRILSQKRIQKRDNIEDKIAQDKVSSDKYTSEFSLLIITNITLHIILFTLIVLEVYNKRNHMFH